MDTNSMLDAICPSCRATCGLPAPSTVLAAALCDPHREYVERHAEPKRSESVTWRRIGDPWPGQGDG